MTGFALLFAAGLLAGAMNALAGGGSFVSLPALIAAGVPSVQANASSTVALWPGGAASAWTFYDDFREICGVRTAPMVAVTLVGGLAGSLLLLFTSPSAFDLVLPWLLLVATLALAFARRIGPGLATHMRQRKWLILLVQLALGVYGGYFGGAVGLMMVATWSLFGETNVKALNAPRTFLVTIANTVAVVTFVVAGAVRWPQTLAMLAGGLAGGVAGARLGRVVPARYTRLGTIAFSFVVTAIFFARAYL